MSHPGLLESDRNRRGSGACPRGVRGRWLRKQRRRDEAGGGGGVAVGWRRRRQDRPAAPGDQDPALRGEDALVRRKGRSSSAPTARSSTATPTRTPPSSRARPRRPSPRAPMCSCSTRSTRARPRDREKAKAQDVPVISYDRLITNADVDYYVSFDNERVGNCRPKRWSTSSKRDGKPDGPIVMINGDPADNNASSSRRARTGARSRRRQDRQGVRHAGLEPRQGPERDGAGDHRARQGRVRRRLRRQRRHSPAARSPR